MELIEEEHHPRIGGPPQDRVAVAVPGEDALVVGQEQAFLGEVAAHGEQAVFPGEARGRKEQFCREAKNRHERKPVKGFAQKRKNRRTSLKRLSASQKAAPPTVTLASPYFSVPARKD